MRITFNNDIDRVIHFVNICTTFKEDIDVTIMTDDQERWVAFRNAITDYLYTEEEQ